MPYLRTAVRASILLVLMLLSLGAAWPRAESRPFRPVLAEVPATESTAVVLEPVVLATSTEKRLSVVEKADAPNPNARPVSRTVKSAVKPQSKATPKKSESKRTSTAEKPTAASNTKGTKSSGSLSRARTLLAAQVARYPILRGTTVEFGDARGYQAISYYKSGRIIISRSHTASLDRIIAHEVWHVIDWRDDQSMDWGENIPPKSSVVSQFAAG